MNGGLGLQHFHFDELGNTFSKYSARFLLFQISYKRLKGMQDKDSKKVAWDCAALDTMCMEGEV